MTKEEAGLLGPVIELAIVDAGKQLIDHAIDVANRTSRKREEEDNIAKTDRRARWNAVRLKQIQMEMERWNKRILRTISGVKQKTIEELEKLPLAEITTLRYYYASTEGHFITGGEERQLEDLEHEAKTIHAGINWDYIPPDFV